MKYVLTFFIFVILLIPIYLYYMDVISTINNIHFNHFKIQINGLSKSSQEDYHFVNGFNLRNIGELKMMDFRHSDCLKSSIQIQSDDFKSTRSLLIFITRVFK